jgi:hypothetical protein
MPIPHPDQKVYSEPDLVLDNVNNEWFFERKVYDPKTRETRYENSQRFKLAINAHSAQIKGNILWRST